MNDDCDFSIRDQMTLAALENSIEAAIQAIEALHLYRGNHPTFDAYLAGRWPYLVDSPEEGGIDAN